MVYFHWGGPQGSVGPSALRIDIASSDKVELVLEVSFQIAPQMLEISVQGRWFVKPSGAKIRVAVCLGA